VTSSLARFGAALRERHVRAVLIGVYGANLYAPSGQSLFVTRDADFFLPLDPDNLLNAWQACDDAGLECWIGADPIDKPRDRWLAERVIASLAATRGAATGDVDMDLTMVMAGFDFETIWTARRLFVVDGAEIAVARLEHIVVSKHAAGRDKDRLFLATHRNALEQMLGRKG
jgi:hypothetical protein